MDDLNYYTDRPKEYNMSVQGFDELCMDLYDLFEQLRDLFKEEDLEPWTSCEFDLTLVPQISFVSLIFFFKNKSTFLV